MNYKEAVRFCDYVLLGEGDETILRFLDAWEKHLPVDFRAWHIAGMAGLSFGVILIHLRILIRFRTEIWSTIIRNGRTQYHMASGTCFQRMPP